MLKKVILGLKLFSIVGVIALAWGLLAYINHPGKASAALCPVGVEKCDPGTTDQLSCITPEEGPCPEGCQFNSDQVCVPTDNTPPPDQTTPDPTPTPPQVLSLTTTSDPIGK